MVARRLMTLVILGLNTLRLAECALVMLSERSGVRSGVGLGYTIEEAQ